ncbi:uncharacterized protein [Venturia canescens]|uniref:uncharacterized protein n=1 Tax=Venturia canescens TaxID=32260 RepID=UPI001C9BEED0|nr:uncharacterized protein LOC122417131 [Venturia canescens]XP_043286340.1 uncharacterized protein LOC122417131 [Venturia canescens]
MKSLALLSLVAFFIFAVDLSRASVLAFGRMRSPKTHDQKATEAPRVCLDPPISLPRCNIAPEDQFELSRQTRVPGIYSASDVPRNPQELHLGENPRNKYTQALTIVYKIEDCIPLRLPFDIPICQSRDIDNRILEVRRLFPFQVVADSEEDTGAPFFFPEFDYNKWRIFAKGSWIRPIENPKNVEKSNVEVSNDMKSELNARKLGKRKELEDPENEDEKAADPLSRSYVAKHRVRRDRSSETNTDKIKTNKTNSSIEAGKRSKENEEEKKNEKYSDRYERAISYDPEKLFESPSDIIDKSPSIWDRFTKKPPYYDFPFGMGKDEKPDPWWDPSETKISPFGRVRRPPPMFPKQEDISTPIRTLLEDDDFIPGDSFLPKNKKPVYPRWKVRSETPLLTPRVVRGTAESSTSDLSSTNDNHEIPHRWSEFPYAKAIPFDPAKLRPQRSDNSLITAPLVFPYATAIPYDSRKLTASDKDNQFLDRTSNPNGRGSSSRD